ncbi:LLM class flavin-dependent oxidoreductase [Streptomyces sp. NPDC091387]|uniref:LLM class flavin-dependent oxidoreductase n=1 Tax=Streptomyces sp. NPDC091387 TaxID=3365998 RepID=UPI00381F881D
MPDLGHDLLFGCFAPPEAARHRAFVRLAQEADQAGLDLLGVQDHPYQPAFLDTWTLLSHLSSVTRRIKLVPAVANLPLRPPAMLARSVATLDLLSDGRVELGLGAGAFWDAIEAMGGTRRTPGESVAALEEAIGVLRALWTDGPGVRMEGTHYRLAGAEPGPLPAHPVGIWLGVYGPRMLRLTGRLADGWLGSASYAPPEKLAGLMRTVDEGARTVGREPSAVRRVYIVDPSFTTAQLTELALTHGLSGFLLSVNADGAGALMRFAAEVAPAVREAVAQERGTPAAPGALPHDARVEHRRLDPSARPVAPPPHPDRPAPSAAGERAAQTLVLVHDSLRDELAQLQHAVGEVLAGRDSPAAARSFLNAMTMRQNYWSLGAFCATYCRVVTQHHLLEDEVMFGKLRDAQEDLTPVLTRLEEEHKLIASLIARLDEVLVAMVEDPSRLEEVRTVLDRLADCLLSHLTYEEEQLLDPIARHNVVV